MNTQKKEKPKGERTSVPHPLSWNIYVKKQCRHKWEMLSYEAWTDGRTAVCHNKPVFWRAYNNEWPISWNYEYIIFGQIIFQNFHQFKAFVGLSDCRIIATAPGKHGSKPKMGNWKIISWKVLNLG